MKQSHRAALYVFTLFGVISAGISFASQDDTPKREQLLEMSRSGPAHEALGRLAGEWEVVMRLGGPTGPETLGAGQAATILDGRFLVVDFAIGDGPETAYRYTLGFDRRHDEYSIVAMDTTGTYYVTARGAESDGVARMRGTDDDPNMARMGFTKKFVFDLEIAADDAFTISLFFVDTRTKEEPLIPYAVFNFSRTG